MKMNVNEYMNGIADAMIMNFVNGCRLYYGKEGALRFAREFGYGLNDFPYPDAVQAAKNSYKALYVPLYVLGPFAVTMSKNHICEEEWLCEVMKNVTQYKWEQLKSGQRITASLRECSKIHDLILNERYSVEDFDTYLDTSTGIVTMEPVKKEEYVVPFQLKGNFVVSETNVAKAQKLVDDFISKHIREIEDILCTELRTNNGSYTTRAAV